MAREFQKVKDHGWRVSDELWEQIRPLLPPPKPHPWGMHNPRVDDRAAMDVILFVLRTGCQWQALNQTGICSSNSAHRRFMEWTEASGIRVGLAIDGANRHDMKLVRATEAGLVVGSPITHSRMANKQRGKLQVVQGYRAAILPLDPTEIGSKGPVPESLWKQWTG
jgi:hypothetical protein